MNQIPLKYVLNPKMELTPHYDKENKLLGFSIIWNGHSYTRGKVIYLKYFSDKAKEYLREKYGERHER
jgi:hypothetical protein